MQLNFINTLPCNINVNYYVRNGTNGKAQLNTTSPTFATPFLEAFKDIDVEASLAEPGNCLGLGSDSSTGLVPLGYANETQGYSVLITSRGGQLIVTRLVEPEQLEKSIIGQPLLG